MRVLTRVLPRELSGSRAIIASLIGAACTAVCAQIAIPLPGNPVPVTLQVFAVLCCGLVLGSKYGLLSQLEYLAMGLMGAPIFAGFRHGPAALAGPDGGYLIGFLVAAFVAGRILELAQNRTPARAFVASLMGVGVIHIFGVAWLSVWLTVFDPRGGAIWAWILGSVPFLGVDVAKAALAAVTCAGRERS